MLNCRTTVMQQWSTRIEDNHDE